MCLPSTFELVRIIRDPPGRSCDPKGGHPCSTTSSADPASVTASGPTLWGLGSRPTSLTSTHAATPEHHPAIRPSRRALRRLARLRAHRPRGRDPGDHPLLPPRASARVPLPHPGPDLPASGPRRPGPPAARPRRSSPTTPARITTDSGRCVPRALSQVSPEHLRPGRVHLLLSTPLRPRIPPGQVRRRARELGGRSAPRI